MSDTTSRCLRWAVGQRVKALPNNLYVGIGVMGVSYGSLGTVEEISPIENANWPYRVRYDEHPDTPLWTAEDEIQALDEE